MSARLGIRDPGSIIRDEESMGSGESEGHLDSSTEGEICELTFRVLALRQFALTTG